MNLYWKVVSFPQLSILMIFYTNIELKYEKMVYFRYSFLPQKYHQLRWSSLHNGWRDEKSLIDNWNQCVDVEDQVFFLVTLASIFIPFILSLKAIKFVFVAIMIAMQAHDARLASTIKTTVILFSIVNMSIFFDSGWTTSGAGQFHFKSPKIKTLIGDFKIPQVSIESLVQHYMFITTVPWLTNYTIKNH